MLTFSFVNRTVLSLAAGLWLLTAVPVESPAREGDLLLGQSSTVDTGVLAPVNELDQALVGVMKAGKATPFQARADMLGPVIDKTFDLQYILRTSVGSNWSSLSADQQNALLSAFRQYTIASYVDNFDSFDQQQFVVNPTPRGLGAGQQVVSTEFVPKSGNSHKLDYVMRKTATGWKVVDVLADGSISRVAVQRSDFSSLLSRGGPKALEASLHQKTQALSRS
jgi:phospholipid transport system substrate-binding protein